jgi:hypothetical protein
MEGSLAFSPDGAQLVFADSGGWLVRTLTIGTGSSEILPDPVSGSPQFSWTSAGLQYVAVIPCSTVCQVLTNVTTGDRLGMYVDESLLAWSTDGRHVAGTTAWCADWACSTRRIEVVVGDWETHQQTVIGRQTDCGLRGPYGMVVSLDGNRVVYGLCSGTYVWSRP